MRWLLLLRLAVVVLRLLHLPREQEGFRRSEAEAKVRGQRLHHITCVGSVPVHRARGDGKAKLGGQSASSSRADL